MHITPDTEADDIRSQWGAAITRETMRTGGARRSRLERLAQIRSRNYDSRLSLDEDHPTAHVDMEGDAPEIAITAREVDQPITDYDSESWDWLVQRAFTIHEVGHIKYTDNADFRLHIEQIPSSDQGTAKQLWNALEDGAIETQIRQRWTNYTIPLLHLRANLFADNQPGFEDPQNPGQYAVPMAQAVFTALLDSATYDSGVYRQLLDPDDDEFQFVSDDDRQTFVDHIKPLVPDVVEDVLSESDAKARNQRIFDFIDTVLPHIDDADADGKSQMNRSDGQSAGMPDDATDGDSGEASEDADTLDDETGQSAGDHADDVAEGEADELQPGNQGDGETTVDVSEELQAELEDAVSDQRMEESGSSSEMMEELQELGSTMAGSEELEDDRLVVPEEDPAGDRSRYEQYKAQSSRFETLLRNRLQKERKTKTKRGQRRGRIDSTSLHRVQSGESGIMMRKSSPDEKDYAFVIVIDRSGSMSGQDIQEAEETATTVGLALEAVGVDVMVIDLYGSKASVAKPFGVDADQRANHLVNGQTGGGTPLAQTVRLGRERLLRVGSTAQTAMLVITDGNPGNPEEYSAALSDCTMPVIGIQLTSGSGDGEEFYHRYVTAQPGSGELQGKLQALVQEAMNF